MIKLLLKYVSIFATIILVNTNAKAQSHLWTKTFGINPESIVSKAIAIDQTGNIYNVGTFAGTVDFNPGPGVNALIATGVKDAFISKLDAAGNFLWVKSIGGDAFAGDVVNPNAITIDLFGNAIIVGNFSGIVDINTDAGSTNTYTSVGSLPISAGAGSSDAFILKLNPAGAYLWSQQIGSASGEFAYGVAADNSGNVFVAGSFGATSDFDGSASINIATPVGQSDIYILKLSTAGAFSFVKTMGGLGSDVANAITLDGAGNIYTTGSFTVTSDFDPGIGSANLTSVGGPDVFISKLSSAGNYLWAKSFGGAVTTGNPNDQGNAIFVDEVGNVYTSGTFRGINAANPIDFNPGVGIDNIINMGASDMFISKLDASGNYLWAKTIGSTTNDIGNSISGDAEGNIYILGSFSGNADFDPDPAIDNFMLPTQTSGGTNSTDLFLVKFDATGIFQSVNTIGSNSTDIGYGLIIDGASNIHITGILSGAADCDPSAATANFTPSGVQDGFTTTWNLCNNVGALPTVAKTKVKSVSAVNIPTIYAGTNCEVIAKVTPNGASPIAGNTTAKVWEETVQPNSTNAKYVKRHYEVTPAANATTATGKVTLYFTQQEFDDFNAVSSVKLPTNANDALGIANLLVEKKAGVSNNGTGLPATYTSGAININPIDADIIWSDGTKRWEVSFSTTGFSGFFIKTQAALLPISWLNVNGIINKQNLATISWKVQEINVLKYELEKSDDGYNFNVIATLYANGNGEFDYNLQDNVTNLNTVVYYRIKQIDIDGSYTYSSIIKLQPYNAKEISVYPNPVKHIATISVGSNSANKKAQITDINGKELLSITIINTSFSIDMTTYPAGIYFLKIENSKTTKIIKQ